MGFMQCDLMEIFHLVKVELGISCPGRNDAVVHRPA